MEPEVTPIGGDKHTDKHALLIADLVSNEGQLGPTLRFAEGNKKKGKKREEESDASVRKDSLRAAWLAFVLPSRVCHTKKQPENLIEPDLFPLSARCTMPRTTPTGSWRAWTAT